MLLFLFSLKVCKGLLTLACHICQCRDACVHAWVIHFVPTIATHACPATTDCLCTMCNTASGRQPVVSCVHMLLLLSKENNLFVFYSLVVYFVFTVEWRLESGILQCSNTKHDTTGCWMLLLDFFIFLCEFKMHYRWLTIHWLYITVKSTMAVCCICVTWCHCELCSLPVFIMFLHHHHMWICFRFYI